MKMDNSKALRLGLSFNQAAATLGFVFHAWGEFAVRLRRYLRKSTSRPSTRRSSKLSISRKNLTLMCSSTERQRDTSPGPTHCLFQQWIPRGLTFYCSLLVMHIVISQSRGRNRKTMA